MEVEYFAYDSKDKITDFQTKLKVINIMTGGQIGNQLNLDLILN